MGCTEMGKFAACCVFTVITIICISIFFPPIGYAVLAIIILAIIAAVFYYCCRRKSDRYPISLLPISAQQLGVASDIPPAFTWDHHDGRRESIVLQPPPPAVMRRIDESPISSLLPTSAQQLEQAGVASDIRAPNINAPAFTWDHGRGESIVVQPPAVMRSIDRHDSYLGGSVTYSETSTLVDTYVYDERY